MFYKKIIGTLTLFTVSAAILFSVFSFVSASSDPQNNLRFDGIVTAKSSDTITLLTANSGTVLIHIGDKTHFIGKLRLEDVGLGDRLRVGARNDGSEPTARTIKKVSCGSGYGRED